MKTTILYCTRALLILYVLAEGLASAATLYEWADKSGETRYGYRPPPGVVGAVVGERARQPREPANPISCRELEEAHLRLIDKEIARVKSLPAGFGPTFDFTPDSKQRFINDLLAHRASLLTGRAPEEFAAPDKKREIRDLKERNQQDSERMAQDLEDQARQLQRQRMELERQRSENMFLMQRYLWYYPWFPYFVVPYR